MKAGATRLPDLPPAPRALLAIALLLLLAPACNDSSPATDSGADIGAGVDTGADTISAGDGPPRTQHLNGVWGSGANDVWIVGDDGTVLRNQGSGFTPVASGTKANLNDVWGKSANQVFFVGDAVARVYDGSSIKEAFTPTDFNSHAVELWAIDGKGDNAWTGGANGTVFKLTSSGSWSRVSPYESLGLLFIAAYAIDATSSWVVLGGLANGIWKHSGGGWNQDVPYTGNLTAIWGNSPSDVWVTAAEGKMLHYDGNSWTTQTVGQPNEIFTGIWGSAADDIWALTHAGAVMHYDGSQWTTTTSPALGTRLNSIWGSGTDNIWAVGNNATILHYDGSAWSKQ